MTHARQTYKADEEHAKCLDGTAKHEGFATTEGIGQEKDKDQTCHDFDYAVDLLMSVDGHENWDDRLTP
jgi:hypothetical protein